MNVYKKNSRLSTSFNVFYLGNPNKMLTHTRLTAGHPTLFYFIIRAREKLRNFFIEGTFKPLSFPYFRIRYPTPISCILADTLCQHRY